MKLITQSPAVWFFFALLCMCADAHPQSSNAFRIWAGELLQSPSDTSEHRMLCPPQTEPAPRTGDEHCAANEHFCSPSGNSEHQMLWNVGAEHALAHRTGTEHWVTGEHNRSPSEHRTLEMVATTSTELDHW